jgi:hypothetical protein
LSEAPALLELILESQKEALEHTTADKALQFAILFDDVIGDTQFMNTKPFTQCFYQVRHVCCTTFICAQHFTKIPRICRLQANFIFYFRGSMSETNILVEEFAPPHMHKKDFARMVVEATAVGFDFLTINMKMDWEKRFRHNLGELIALPPMGSSRNYDLTSNTNNGDSFSEYPQGPGQQSEERWPSTRARE